MAAMTPRRSIIITAVNGCGHATLPLRAVRDQMTPQDELIVVEPQQCGVPDGPREHHIGNGDTDDFLSVLQGCSRASGDTLIVLEDHVVIEEGFLEAVSTHLARPGVAAVTFRMVNGTAEGLGSRALFAYVAGFATADAADLFPEPVCSSFATNRGIIDSWLEDVDNGACEPGALQTRVIPQYVRQSRAPVDPSLVVTHYQDNTVAEAITAVHWNARRAGALDAQHYSGLRSMPLSVRRYLARSVILIGRHRREPDLALPLLAVGIAGWAGWWIGRLRGSAAAGEHLAAAHPPVR